MYICMYIYIYFLAEPFENKLKQGDSIWYFCIYPKNKEILLHNHNTITTLKEFNVAAISELYTNV